MNDFYLPLMENNITRDDLDSVIEFLKQDPIPKLTNGPKVLQFENVWSNWLDVKHSLFVNSGAAANELTMLAIEHLYGKGEVIVPPLTWISDIASVIFAGHDLVFCDINMTNLSFDIEQLKSKITKKTRAIFLTHVLGVNGLTDELLDICNKHNISLIEDVCESHGTTFRDRKVGTYGFASNFSFYFAHHMSTIEGGMICTNNSEFYQTCRALRSHGMAREMTDEFMKNTVIFDNPELNKDFIFIRPAHNFRSTEINAVIGLNQLTKLDVNNSVRKSNCERFYTKLSAEKYHTDIDYTGQCSYAFIVILKNGTLDKRNSVERSFMEHGIEFRRGLSGGGNQIRQPFIEKNYNFNVADFPVVDYIHKFSWYIGNYPSLPISKIDVLTTILNHI